MSRWGLCLKVLAVWLAFLPVGSVQAGERTPSDTASPEGMDLARWLVAGPVVGRVPLFAVVEAPEVSGTLLDEPALPAETLWPEAGQSLGWSPGESLVWRERSAEGGRISLPGTEGEASVVLLACYLESPRWQKLDCVVESRNALTVLLEGKEVARRKEAAASDTVPETVAALTLPTGKSRLLIRTALAPGDSLDRWDLRVFLRIPQERRDSDPQVSLSPERTLARLRDFSSIVGAEEAAVSPDGKRFVVCRRRWIPETDQFEDFLEIRGLPGGDLQRTLDLRAAVSSPVWSPDGSRLAVSVGGEEGTSDLWILDLDRGTFEKLLGGKKSLANVAWCFDGRSVLFTAVSKEQDGEESKYERLTEPYMRWPGWEDRVHLWVVSLSDRVEEPLTAGEFSIVEVTACTSQPLVAFLRNVPIDVRPYEKLELWTLDLETREVALERELRYPVVGDLTFGPRGDRLAWVASPSEVDTLPTSPDHNAYEQDIYLWDRRERALSKLTEGFDPSVGADLYGARGEGRCIWWNPGDGDIYFTATDGGRNRLYGADPESRDIVHLPVDLPTVYGLSGSDDGRTLLFYGSAIDRPSRLYSYDLRRRRTRELLFPGESVHSRISFGPTERWDFTNSRGERIEGWLYYPPGFEPARAYPMIVYYYGGVFPNGEAYVWRNHYLAANGYVVYVLNPAGAVGYGSAFADEHVNDWGELAAEDVIEGVERLLGEKPFIDRERVGAFGGSYGGFLTMQLLTKTDLFAAAEASYGISNITSYWGEGRWGYLYGDVALAGSYPWNRPDIFVERSPLFRADRIRTPLLLTHGTGDTNVPSGESDQMFTALRVLRRNVVYVRFPGQEHGIVGTQGIRVAHNEIRLEWFDRYLKDQPEAWEERWEE